MTTRFFILEKKGHVMKIVGRLLSGAVASLLIVYPLVSCSSGSSSKDDDSSSSSSSTTSSTSSTSSTSGSKSTSSSTSGGVGSTTVTKDGTEITIEDAGTAAGNVTSGYAGVDIGTLGLNLTESTNDCESGSYSLTPVGHSAEFSSGTFTNSAFSGVEAPNIDAVLSLTCADGTVQRCFVKAGDNGILCNKVADSVIDAFEAAIGKELTDSTFQGAAISKIASSIVSASEIAGPETEQFIADLKKCKIAADLKLCYSEAIGKSPFLDSFKIMQQITTGWTAEGLFLFVTGVLGKSIDLDSELYSPIFDTLAEARGDGFIEQVRELVGDVVKSQKAQDGKFAFAIKCAVEINGEKKYFEPDLDDNDELSCDRTDLNEILTAAGIPSTYFDDIAEGSLHGEVTCTLTNSHNGMCYARLSMEATALSTEPNRNDIDGTHMGDRQENSRSISLVDVMPQVMIALKKHHIDLDKDGPPEIDSSNQDAFSAAIEESKDYFLGLLGVYKFINDPTVVDKKLSLNDLHEIFVGDEFMRSRLTSWGPGITGIQAGSANDQVWAPPMLAPTDKEGEFTVDSIFKFDMKSGGGGGPSESTVSMSVFKSAFNDSKPLFRDTFEMFTKIPTATEIGDFVFNSSHHEDWNPMGSKFISVAQFGNTGRPITCMMENSGPGQSLIADTIITCDEEQDDVECDEEGSCTFPDEYDYSYVLMERGWYGEDKGRLFTLGSRKTGLELRSNGGRGVMIKEYKSGNDAGKCDEDQIGTVVKYIEEFYCGPNVKCQEKTTAFCMDMEAFGTPARKRFYPGGQLTVSNQNTETGEKWEWQVPLVGAYNGSDHSKDSSVCLFVPSGSFVPASGQSGSKATTNVDTSTGYLSLAGISGALGQDCSEDAASGFTKYYLYNWRDFSGSDAMYVWLLDDSNKFTVQFKNEPDDGMNWETTNAKLSKTDVESLLSGKTIAGNAATQINGMRFHNPRHDPKFDPYCDDTNGNGVCDCYALKSMNADRTVVTFEDSIRSNPEQCGLLDKTAEPTLSELPYCAQCGNAEDAIEFFELFGGKEGSELTAVSAYFDTHHPNFNVQSAAFCQYKFEGQSVVGQPKWIDWAHWGSAMHPGCPATEGEERDDDSKGPIRVINPQPMRNAFNVARPNTLIKLINYATKSVGQGVAIDADAKVFSLDEAIALVALRNLLPPDHIVVMDEDGDEITGMSPQFQSISDPDGKNSDSFSSLLKGILFKAEIFTQEDLDVEEPERK